MSKKPSIIMLNDDWRCQYRPIPDQPPCGAEAGLALIPYQDPYGCRPVCQEHSATAMLSHEKAVDREECMKEQELAITRKFLKHLAMRIIDDEGRMWRPIPDWTERPPPAVRQRVHRNNE